MKTKNRLCSTCENRIEQYGCLCVEFMQELCENAFKGDSLCYHETHSPLHVKTIIKFLENKQFVVSSDLLSDVVVIMPNLTSGSFNDEKKVFCWCERAGKLP